MTLILDNKKVYSYNINNYDWLFSGSGGYVRFQIICNLLNQSLNAYQLSKKIKGSYNNIKYHLSVLEKYDIILSDHKKYNEKFYISKSFDISFFNQISEFYNNCQKFPVKRSSIRNYIKKQINKKVKF
ncbi:MAG: hypothetical protein ACTSPY_04915 [Candidatus Helarchaeota archaeon]